MNTDVKSGPGKWRWWGRRIRRSFPRQVRCKSNLSKSNRGYCGDYRNRQIAHLEPPTESKISQGVVCTQGGCTRYPPISMPVAIRSHGIKGRLACPLWIKTDICTHLPMSAKGQKQTCAMQNAMSAKGQSRHFVLRKQYRYSRPATDGFDVGKLCITAGFRPHVLDDCGIRRTRYDC